MNDAKRVKLSHDTPNGPLEDGNSVSVSQEFLQLHGSLQDARRRQTDPMKIELVLERVFDFCSVESLKSCRRVSRQWRDESMKAWRDKAALTCLPASFYGNFTLTLFKDYTQLLESSADDDDAKLRNVKQYPFRCLNLYSDLNDFSEMLTPRICEKVRYLKFRRYSESPEILREFLEKFKSLEILHFDSCKMERLYEVNEGRSFKLLKLRRLKIINDKKSDRSIEQSKVWEFVLLWCPNLEALSFVYDEPEKEEVSEVVEHVQSSFCALREVRESAENSMMHLKELELCVDAAIMRRIAEDGPDVFRKMCNSWRGIIRSIVGCKFPLEQLTITLGWEDIHRLLKSCKGTLRYLKTSFHYNLDGYTSPHGSGTNWKQIEIIKHVPAVPVRMRHLKEASLGSGHIRALCLLTHLELPNLEKLTIEKDESAMVTEFGNIRLSFPKGRIYKRLETLEFLDNQKMPLPPTIESLTKMMPNLAHLMMPLDKATFPIVCKKLPGLKTLNILSAQIRFEEIDDETLTGVSKDNGDGGPRRPNITDLGLLTCFKISCESQLLGKDVKFTDHSVIHGFLLLPHLYLLSIAFKDLSEDVKDKLLSHVKGNVCFQEKPPFRNHSIVGIGDGDEDAMNEGSGDSELEEEEQQDKGSGESESEEEEEQDIGSGESQSEEEEDKWTGESESEEEGEDDSHDGSSNSDNEASEDEMEADSSEGESEDE